MSNDNQCIDYSLLDINYCEDTTQTMNQTDTLPAEDRHGITMRENVLTGLAKMACTPNPLIQDAAVRARNYNHLKPQVHYNWSAIAAKLGSASLANDEATAQAIAFKQSDVKPTIQDDEFTIDGKLGPKTIKALHLEEETTEFVKKQNAKQKTKVDTENQNKKNVLGTETPSIDPTKSNSKKSHKSSRNQEETDLPTWYANKYSEAEIQNILKLVQSTQTVINEISVEEIKKWQTAHTLKPDGKFGNLCFKKINDSHKTSSKQKTKSSKRTNTNKQESNKFDPQKAVYWNDEHFKTKTDPKGVKTWQTLAQKLNVSISEPITNDNKLKIVEELRNYQIKIDETPDGCYGIKSIRSLESAPIHFDINNVDFEKRQQNIESFLATSNAAFKDGKMDPQYMHRHARYLTEFMNISDSQTQNGGEQIPFDLVLRMMLDDLCTKRHENLGLLALWIGTAEWGVSSIPSDLEDPVPKKKWTGPDMGGGKRAREYDQGGVGIAHYDVAKLADFYKTFLNENSPNLAPDCKKKLMKDANTATLYDDVKSYHAFYEIMSELFDQDRGVAGDEWNDKAAIWLMENWLDTTWEDAQQRMPNNSKTAMFARMQNSAHIPVDGTNKTYATTYDNNIQFKRITASSSVELMEKQYGDYGAIFHKNKHTDEYARDNYIARLQLPKRVMVLQDFVTENYKEKGFTVSEDGANVLDKNGQIVK